MGRGPAGITDLGLTRLLALSLTGWGERAAIVAYTSVTMASRTREPIRAVMPHVLHKKPASMGAKTPPASSPMLIQLMVRARLRLSKLEI